MKSRRVRECTLRNSKKCISDQPYQRRRKRNTPSVGSADIVGPGMLGSLMSVPYRPFTARPAVKSPRFRTF